MYTHPTPKIYYRVYNVSALLADGRVEDWQHTLPATVEFERICAVLGHGALVDTPHGAKSIEDMRPGDTVMTRSGQRCVRGIVSTTMTPPTDDMNITTLNQLIRLQTSALAQGHMGDLILGPHAKVGRISMGLEHFTSPSTVFGDDIAFRIRAHGNMQVYQILLSSRDAIRVQGIDVLSSTVAAKDFGWTTETVPLKNTQPLGKRIAL